MRRVAPGHLRTYDAMQREIADRRRAEELLRLVAEGTAGVTGQAFFRSLVGLLATAFQVRVALVAEIRCPGERRAATLAFLRDGIFLDDYAYDLEGTPCDRVIDGDLCYYPNRLNEYFPDMHDLEAYLGIPLRDAAGAVLGHLAVMHDQPLQHSGQDIALLRIFATRAGTELERQRAEAALRESEARYRFIYNHTPVMMHSVDRHGRLISVSDYWLQMTGYTREEVLGRPSKDVLSPASQHYYATTGRPDFLQRGYVKDREYEVVRKDGSLMHVLISALAEAERSSDGTIERSLAVLVDITQRKRAEAALHEREEQLRQANEQLADYTRNLEAKVAERTQEIERRRQVAECLRDMLAILNSSRPLQEILDFALGEATKLLGTESGVIYRLRPDDQMFVVQAAHGPLATITPRPSFALERSFLGRAVMQVQPVVIDNLPTAIHAPEIEMPPAWAGVLSGYQTLLAVPLVRQGASDRPDGIYGGIALYYHTARQFSDDEIDLAMAFADQAALAIENAHLHRRVEQAAVLEERGRLARELHDSVTQSLYSLTLLAEGWRRLAVVGRLDDTAEALTELGNIGQQALKEMRLLVHQLRPPDLQSEGLLGALHKRLGAVERRAGVETRLLADDVLELPAVLEEALYRIAQEALNNALKHAAATTVTVEITTGGAQVALAVTDNGCGFDPAALPDEGGLGLRSMRERAEYLGGSLEVTAPPQQGACIRVRVPLAGAMDEAAPLVHQGARASVT